VARIVITQRNDLLILVTVRNENGGPEDLSGSSLYFRTGRGKIAKSIGNGITVTDAKGGAAEILLTHEDLDLPMGEYGYELLYVDVDGHRYTVLKGVLDVQPSLMPLEVS